MYEPYILLYHKVAVDIYIIRIIDTWCGLYLEDRVKLQNSHPYKRIFLDIKEKSTVYTDWKILL